MVPTAEQTAANRQLMAGACRLAGALMIGLAGYTWIGQIEFGVVYGVGVGTLGPGWLSQFFTMLWDSMYWSPVALVLMGAVFLSRPDPIAAWLVRVPTRTLCPGCGYEPRRLVEPICPECGLHLSDAFLADPAPPESREST